MLAVSTKQDVVIDGVCFGELLKTRVDDGIFYVEDGGF